MKNWAGNNRKEQRPTDFIFEYTMLNPEGGCDLPLVQTSFPNSRLIGVSHIREDETMRKYC